MLCFGSQERRPTVAFAFRHLAHWDSPSHHDRVQHGMQAARNCGLVLSGIRYATLYDVPHTTASMQRSAYNQTPQHDVPRLMFDVMMITSASFKCALTTASRAALSSRIPTHCSLCRSTPVRRMCRLRQVGRATAHTIAYSVRGDSPNSMPRRLSSVRRRRCRCGGGEPESRRRCGRSEPNTDVTCCNQAPPYLAHRPGSSQPRG